MGGIPECDDPSVAGDVLLCVGPKDIHRLEAGAWKELVHPDNQSSHRLRSFMIAVELIFFLGHSSIYKRFQNQLTSLFRISRVPEIVRFFDAAPFMAH